MLGGSLTVASEFGVGTCFTLRVPRVAPVLERAAESHSGDNGETE
jgi:hypothetical protein